MMADPELDELKREFLAEAQEKVAEIQSTLDGERNSASFERLTYLAHQLKGSGGSYGFQRISTESAELEKAIERMATGDGTLENQVQQHVRNLVAEIERGARELTPA
jgi:HPt (histidine-containing phosphotransfer) domain-containing protein